MSTVTNFWKDDFTDEIVDVEIYQSELVHQELSVDELAEMDYYDGLASELDSHQGK